MGRGAAGAEDGHDDNDDNGDDAQGHDDHQHHVAVQRGRGAAMGTVTAWEGWGEEKRLIYYTGKASSAHQRHLESCRPAGGDGLHEKCLFVSLASVNCFCTIVHLEVDLQIHFLLSLSKCKCILLNYHKNLNTLAGILLNLQHHRLPLEPPSTGIGSAASRGHLAPKETSFSREHSLRTGNPNTQH